jgi:hypothetical protein
VTASPSLSGRFDASARFQLEVDRIKRDINLTKFAAAYGYARVASESSVASVSMRHANGDKLIVSRRLNGHWVYFSVGGSDKGTIIDFVKHRSGTREVPAILDEIRRIEGITPANIEPKLYQDRVGRVSSDPAAVARAFDQAREVPTSRYLNSRGLRPETLQLPRFRGTWREDSRANVIFPHVDHAGAICGFEKKNDGFTRFATGGTKTAWISQARSDDRQLVITESAIDAMSYHQIHQPADARYLSTAGTLSQQQFELIERAMTQMPPRSTAVIATDNDDAGHKMAAAIAELAQRAPIAVHRPLAPVGKDWNDCLKHLERDYITSIRPRSLAR